MKKLAALTILFFFASITAQTQSRITERNLIGTWKMKIKVDEVLEELEKESEEAETILAEVLLKSVSGVVEGVLDRIDIYIEFKKDGEAMVMVNAFDQDTEKSDTKWDIRGGKLYIEDSGTDDLNWDGNDGWVMKDGVLILEDDDSDTIVLLTKLD